MNWYSVFYWITVADGVKTFFDYFSNLFTALAIITFIVYVILIAVRAGEEYEVEIMNFWVKRFGTFFYVTMVLSFLTWGGYVFIPSKKDALIIVAGGSVGNFITSDSAAKKIPAEVMVLLRDKIRSEIKEINSPNVSAVQDTLASKSKEELIEILHNKR